MLLILLAGAFASAANLDVQQQRPQFVRSPKLVTGLVAPVLTAFHPNGTLNVAAVPAQAAALAAQGRANARRRAGGPSAPPKRMHAAQLAGEATVSNGNG